MKKEVSQNGFTKKAGPGARKYSDEELTRQVQELAKELGRTPKQKEFDRNPGTARTGTIESRFGSWNKFLEAAGLEINRSRSARIANKKLIRQVKILATELGRTPIMEEFDKDPRMASTATIRSKFGSWNNFIEAAGLKANKPRPSGDELIQQVQMLAQELGRTPTAKEFDADSRTAWTGTAQNRFGSWNKFLEAAGLKINKKMR